MHHYAPAAGQPLAAAQPLRGAGSSLYGIAAAQPQDVIKAMVIPSARVAQGGRLVTAAALPGPALPAAVYPAAVQTAPGPQALRPKLFNLPQFQPPAFEGANGALPCPESPGSTPRGEGDQEEGGAEADRPGVPHAVGAGVEYHSRSSGQWIPARVEGFDAASQTYKLDVQPNARAERIRARRSGPASSAPAAAAQHQTPEKQRAPEAAFQAPAASAAGATEGMSPQQDLQPAATPPRDSRPSLPSESSPSQPNGTEVCTSRQHAEVEELRKQVAWLQAANATLQQTLACETELKDRYLSDLTACRELLQASRETPR